MQKFLVLYKTPISVLDSWMETPQEERAAMEAKMKSDWDAWMAAHSSNMIETAGAGKTKKVTGTQVEDIRNDIMLYSLVQAESHEAAAQMFADHPHFGIPEATIEIMVANVLPGLA